MKKIKEITEARVHQDIVLYDGYADSWVLCHVEIAEDNLLVLHRVKGLLESDLPEDVISNKTKSDCKKIILRETDTHWIHYQLPSDSQDESVVTLYSADGLSIDDKEAPKVKKLTDKQFFCLKKGDLVIEDYDNGEFRILTEVIDTNPERSVKLKGIGFLPTGDAEEDAENAELLKQFPKTVTISNTDKYATLFSGYQILPSGETPVTNSLVAYYKPTPEDMVCECI